MKLLHDNSLMPRAHLRAIEKKAASYLSRCHAVVQDNDYSAPEASLLLPSDVSILKSVREMHRCMCPDKPHYVVVVGIGGSNLGAKAVYDALAGSFDVVSPDRFPKIIFLDTVYPDFLSFLDSFFESVSDDSEVLVNVVSKSGHTLETLANFELLMPVLAAHLRDPLSRVVVTTGEGSALWDAAQAQDIAVLPIPGMVGGRYSVFSSVGLFPLLAAGFNMTAFLRGARDMRGHCLESRIEKNPALLGAAFFLLHMKKGRSIHDFFLFNPSLRSLGDWCRQLIAESLGKERSSKGKKVSLGITPTVSIGSTDLHSMAQLYLGGPRDKMTTFVSLQSRGRSERVRASVFPGLVPEMEGVSAKDIVSAFLEGTQTAYVRKKLPFLFLDLSPGGEKVIGSFMQYQMMVVMYAAFLLDINAFDQPNVEEYKREVKKILS